MICRVRERFANEETWLIWNGETTNATRGMLPLVLYAKARRQLSRVVLAERRDDCAIFQDFKRLHGNPTGRYQFRINHQFRVRFIWENGNAMQIEVGNFHDEDKIAKNDRSTKVSTASPW